jgi:hypothetical protein
MDKPCPALSHWLSSCCEQLAALTAQAPQAPTDYRRTAALTCKCADCAELRQFLENPQESVHRFRAVQNRRSHLEDCIRQHHCDLECRTEKRGSPHTLVCTKTAASYQEKVRTYHQNQEHLAALRAIQASLPQ